MSEPLDPENYHSISSKSKRNLILVLFLVVFVLIPPVAYSYYKFAVYRPGPNQGDIDFEIKRGDSVPGIASSLFQAGAINSEVLFNFYVMTNGLDKNIQAGIYKIRPGNTIVDLAAMFQHGINDVEITFLEGWRLEEYARAANKTFKKVSYTKFLSLAKDLEGHLFPDTYRFHSEVTEEEIIAELRKTFDEKTKDVLTNSALSKAGLTKDQALIMASIVEREVNKPEDREVVAGILIKRFKEGTRIDADATTQYAVSLDKLCPDTNASMCTPTLEEVYEFNFWPKDLTLEDLDSDSPYNTRKIAGLPPAPISSFSLSALQSVLNHKQTDYYFYLTDSHGNTYYAKTLDEHNANIVKYL